MTPMQPRPQPGDDGFLRRALDRFERIGNRFPDPAALFVVGLLLVWVTSATLSGVSFTDIDPRSVVRDASGAVVRSSPIQIHNLLAPERLVRFLTQMIRTFTEFPPLGIVLVAMLGVGVAERTGFIQVGIKILLRLTPRDWLSPMLLLVALISHSAGDAGFVLVVPIGGVLFAAAGRHPVAGIACAYAGVASGFSATFLPSSLDPLLQGFTQSAAQILEPGRQVNPLCNWYFMGASSALILLAGWWLTDRVIEPGLNARLVADGDPEAGSDLNVLSPREAAGFRVGLGALLVMGVLLFLACLPAGSPLRGPDGGLTSAAAPLMEAIVPLIAGFFLLPGILHGIVAGTVKSHRDVFRGMSESLGTMGPYLVLAFFAAQFTYAFRESNLGALTAIRGAELLKASAMPTWVTLTGLVLIALGIDLVIGSASAKWAIMAPILVPMLMQVGISPELTQAAYRIGDSCANTITPLNPYFPLVVLYCQRHARSTGIGTLFSTMLPYALVFLVLWTALLGVWWGLGWPLGLLSK
jgi:aminobenzoyl-glutamate transport protein